MSALVVEGIAFIAVLLSFGLAALVLMLSHREREVNGQSAGPGEPTVEDPVETMSRVLAEVERLAALRERRVLTTKEFVAQKAKLLEGKR
jgi:hypothetical protein